MQDNLHNNPQDATHAFNTPTTERRELIEAWNQLLPTIQQNIKEKSPLSPEQLTAFNALLARQKQYSDARKAFDKANHSHLGERQAHETTAKNAKLKYIINNIMKQVNNLSGSSDSQASNSPSASPDFLVVSPEEESLVIAYEQFNSLSRKRAGITEALNQYLQDIQQSRDPESRDPERFLRDGFNQYFANNGRADYE